MRIYFFWDEDTNQVVVGRFPSHLSNRIKGDESSYRFLMLMSHLFSLFMRLAHPAYSFQLRCDHVKKSEPAKEIFEITKKGA